MKPRLSQLRLGDAAWLISWVPRGEHGCSGYANACQCPACQARDRRIGDEPLPDDFRAELRGIVRGNEPPPFARCHGYSNACSCANCKRRAERIAQRQKLRQLERAGQIEREPDDPSEEFRQMMRSNRGIPGT